MVVLSRFNDPLHVMHYKHGIGLRYGTLGSFLSTSQKIYCYSTRDADGTTAFDFWPTAPLIFDKANTTGSVVVGYICNPTEPMDQYRGRLVYYYFNFENDHHPVCIYNDDNKRYSSIKDFSYHGSEQTVVLLEGSSTRITCNSYYPTRDSVMTVIYSETTAVKTMKFDPNSTLSERVCTDLN